MQLQKSLPGCCFQWRVQVRVTGMNMANPNSHDLLVERQAWKIWREFQMSTCTSPTRGFNFVLSQRTTERGKVWKEFCQTVNHVICWRTGEGGIPHHNLYYPAFFAIVGNKLNVHFSLGKAIDICSQTVSSFILCKHRVINAWHSKDDARGGKR